MNPIIDPEELERMKSWFKAYSEREGQDVVWWIGMDDAVCGKAYVCRNDKMRWVVVYEYEKLIEVVANTMPEFEDPVRYVESMLVDVYSGASTPVCNIGMIKPPSYVERPEFPDENYEVEGEYADDDEPYSEEPEE